MDKETLLSSFGKWVAPLNANLISEWTMETGEDKYVKKLHSLAFLLIFIDAQLNQRKALRDIVTEIESNEAFQKELGITSISTSQLSRKNNKLSRELLQKMFVDLVAQISRLSLPSTRRIGTVKLLDSTTMSLCLSQVQMGCVSEDKGWRKAPFASNFL